jgi:hypothetical protein
MGIELCKGLVSFRVSRKTKTPANLPPSLSKQRLGSEEIIDLFSVIKAGICRQEKALAGVYRPLDAPVKPSCVCDIIIIGAYDEASR